MKKAKRLAVLTGGGDCPGLNAAIRAVAKTARSHDIEVFGVEQGFLGLYNGKLSVISDFDVSGIINRGGTILRSSRFNPFAKKEHVKIVKQRVEEHNIDGLVVIGGDGSLGVALDCWKKLKIPTIGIPKTIDNDVYGTDFTIGFQTAVQTAVDAIDKLHTTAESHDFIMVVELMGRHCGFLACHAGLASGADLILVPEQKNHMEYIAQVLQHRHFKGKNYSIVVVAEDAKVYEKGRLVASTPSLKDSYGKIKLGGIGWQVRDLLQKGLGYETRCTVLGHVQRGGEPVAFDRILATQMGHFAIEMVLAGKWGKMIAYEKGQILAKDLHVVREGEKRLPEDFYKMSKVFFDT